MWAVVEGRDGYRLSSIVYPAVWEPGRPFESVCRRTLAALPWARPALHEPPGFDCVCGVYAARDASRALPYLRSSPGRAPAERCRAVGTVMVWGRVVEAEAGWRGQAAYPRHLVVSLPERRLGLRRGLRGERVAADLLAYGVEVQVGDPAIVLRGTEAPRSRATRPVSLGSGMPTP